MKKTLIILSVCAIVAFAALYIVRLQLLSAEYNRMCESAESYLNEKTFDGMKKAMITISDSLKKHRIDKIKKMADTLWLKWLKETDMNSVWIRSLGLRMGNYDSAGIEIDAFSSTPKFFDEEITHLVPELNVESLKNIRVNMHVSYDTCSFDTILIIRTNHTKYVLNNYPKIKEKQALACGIHKLKVEFVVSAMNDTLAETVKYNSFSDSISYVVYSPQLVFNIDTMEFSNSLANNVINNYGEKLYASKIRYITPRIKYHSNKSANVTLFRKIYFPKGNLLIANRYIQVPLGYSYIGESVNLKRGNNDFVLIGLGDD